MVVARRGRVPLPVLAARRPRSPSQAHNGDAPLVAALVGALVVAAVDARGAARHDERRDGRDPRRARRRPPGCCGCSTCPAAAAASSSSSCSPAPRSARASGCCSACARWRCRPIVTGGIGPWLPFQMLALGVDGRAAPGFVGRVTRRLDPRLEVVVLAAYGWVWGFLYGAIMNLWFWPFARGGALDWHPGLDLAETLHRYWSFYVATSLGWDAAAAHHERGAHPRHRPRAHAHPPPLRPPPRPRRRVRPPPPRSQLASADTHRSRQVDAGCVRGWSKSSVTNSSRAARPSGVVTSPTKTAARVSSDSSARAVLAEGRGVVGRTDEHDDVHVRTTSTADTARKPHPSSTRPEHRARLLHGRGTGGDEREHEEPRVAQQRTDREVTLRRRRAEAVARSTVVAHDPAHEHDREHGERRAARANSATTRRRPGAGSRAPARRPATRSGDEQRDPRVAAVLGAAGPEGRTEREELAEPGDDEDDRHDDARGERDVVGGHVTPRACARTRP